MFVKKKISLWLIFLISLIFLASGYAMAQEGPAEQVRGTVKSIAETIKTISITIKDKGDMLFKYSDKTKLVNIIKIDDVKPGEAVIIDYQRSGKDLLATVVTLSLVKLPEGVSEIKTPELVELVRKGTDSGKYMLVDCRPFKRFEEGHIPTAISIPVDDFEKKASLLPADKNTLVIFYCGGPT
ncbi:MAG: rhodanese-like domain-containing protein [Thermodesulfovibrionales bacterium]|nr:rhodanese-like domain-containing protein [Thermodesulfovibrionales bacterium]